TIFSRDWSSDVCSSDLLVQRILDSQLFFSPLARARKIRSPVELAIGLLRALEGTANLQRLATEIAQLGQSVFFPPSVKGWEGGQIGRAACRERVRRYRG